MSDDNNKTKSTSRLYYIDGLRGIAAALVTVFHIAGNLTDSTPSWMRPFAYLASRGYLGVDIFFVISGFVIALTLGRHTVTWDFAWRFAARRAVRLDPPYWVSILAAVALMLVAQRLFPDVLKTLPSAAQVAAHLIYAQNLLGYGDIVPIYWSLCLEVQFYIVLLAMCAVAQGTSRSPEPTQGSVRFQLIVLACAFVSLASFTDVFKLRVQGTFVPYWFLFGMGAACAAVHLRWIKEIWLAPYLAACALFGVVNSNHLDALVVGCLTTCSILLASRIGAMQKWLSSWPFQYLGRISYSLYLIHASVGWSAVSVSKRLLPLGRHPSLSIIAFGIGIAASAMAAQIIYSLIERPSVKLSHRIRYGNSVEPSQRLDAPIRQN